MLLKTGLFLFAICLESHLVRTISCDQKLRWGEIISVPDDDKRTYKNNLHCTYEGKFLADIEPNAMQLTWYAFEISGEMPDCPTDYLEIYVR